MSSFGYIGELEPGVLDRLVEKSQNLTTLQIHAMTYTLLTDTNRKKLADMVKNILEHRPHLIEVNFACFSMSAEHGKIILQALSYLSIPTIRTLLLCENSDWWNHEKCF